MNNNKDIDFELIDRVLNYLVNKFINFDKPVNIDCDVVNTDLAIDFGDGFTYKECLTLKKLGILQRSDISERKYITFDYADDWEENLIKLKREANIDSIITE